MGLDGDSVANFTLPPAPYNSNNNNSNGSNNNELIEPLDASCRAKLASSSCISLRGLTKVFSTPDGPICAVNGVDADLFLDECTVLAGHNSAGKSTTVAMLTGLLQPTAGTITAFGKQLRRHAEMVEFRKSLGVVLQQDVLWPELTVTEHLRFFDGVKGGSTSPLGLAKAITDVGLTEKAHARAGTLSGGQRRKLSLAIALLCDPRVLVLDEVSSAQVSALLCDPRVLILWTRCRQHRLMQLLIICMFVYNWGVERGT